ncbi:ParB/RepB/Spo0J family partition protein [Pollutimonas bauzanensis]|uniref:Chromosome partitioning protein, ParB family n=1 Tax=Pollutimonas bauzanensis TaxID=658167 RepID=A0A1M5YKM5_9BURK|nr:ParB/RepB/Spo0J family partition protein [Pollutimonas bauzanensis]SHI12438.1 chromosome partitioning protein, ParB family [Pollutimonas bauzanensis]
MNYANRLAAKQSAGLDLAGLGDLAAMLNAPVSPSSKPQMFDLDRIREGRNQRSEDNPGFSKESIAELAQSMTGGRGIKVPLSLRPDPDAPGYYIINHGHRRYRGAKVAGLKQVPGFIDEHFDKYDQLIENIQREGHTAREIADFIGSELADGKTLTQVAQLLGKSKAFVSQHMKLLNLPDPVADAFFSGRVQDITLVNELARAHKENPRLVEQTLAEAGDSLAAKQVTRETVKALRKQAVKRAGKSGKPAKGGDVRRMENALSDRLATTVSISERQKGKRVQLIVFAQNWEHFNDLLVRLGFGELVDGSV